MKSTQLFVLLTLGLALALGALWLLDGRLTPVTAAPGQATHYVDEVAGGPTSDAGPVQQQPVLQAIHPPRNAVTAALNTTVTAAYDLDINSATVTSVTFAVHGMQSGLVTETHGVVSGDTLIVTPSNPFHQGELVYAIATTGTLSLAGAEPVSATQWQFNAGAVTNRCVSAFVTDTVASVNLTDVYYGSVAWGITTTTLTWTSS